MSRKMARKQMQPAQQLGGGNFITFSLTMAQMKKKKKTQQDASKFLWLKIPGFLEQSSERKIMCSVSKQRDVWYPGCPQLCFPAHTGASASLPAPLQTEATCSPVASVLVYVDMWGHVCAGGEVCVELVRGTTLGCCSVLGAITLSSEMHLSQRAASLIPLSSVLRAM